jgi:hypothetical protein
MRHERSPNHKSPSLERRPMAAIDVNQKADIYETLSSLNRPLLESSSTFKPCTELDYSNPKWQSSSLVLLLNCKPNSTRNLWKTCTSLSLTTGAVMGRRDNAGKSTCAILTMYCFKPRNEKSNLRNNARNPDTRLQIETRQTRRDKAGSLYSEQRWLKLLRISH